MSNQKDLVSTNEVPVTPTNHIDAAQALVVEIRAMRQQIPNLVTTATELDIKRLVPAASVPPKFVELTSVAVKNSPEPVGPGLAADDIPDPTIYPHTYLPVPDALHAL